VYHSMENEVGKHMAPEDPEPACLVLEGLQWAEALQTLNRRSGSGASPAPWIPAHEIGTPPPWELLQGLWEHCLLETCEGEAAASSSSANGRERSATLTTASSTDTLSITASTTTETNSTSNATDIDNATNTTDTTSTKRKKKLSAVARKRQKTIETEEAPAAMALSTRLSAAAPAGALKEAKRWMADFEKVCAWMRRQDLAGQLDRASASSGGLAVLRNFLPEPVAWVALRVLEELMNLVD
ncbi:unnamed protein product, partial [Polarella glacialis]